MCFCTYFPLRECVGGAQVRGFHGVVSDMHLTCWTHLALLWLARHDRSYHEIARTHALTFHLCHLSCFVLLSLIPAESSCQFINHTRTPPGKANSQLPIPLATASLFSLFVHVSCPVWSRLCVGVCLFVCMCVTKQTVLVVGKHLTINQSQVASCIT